MVGRKIQETWQYQYHPDLEQQFQDSWCKNEITQDCSQALERSKKAIETSLLTKRSQTTRII